MNQIELVYDKDCPNVEQARQNLREALRRADLPNTWQEWDRNNPASPDHAKRFGSPAILIDGKDVAGIAQKAGNNCRVYPDGNSGFGGAPSVEKIVKALQTHPRKSWAGAGGLLPVMGAAFLPKIVCPACWPAYSWLLGVMGLEFINYTPWLFPLTGVFLIPVLGMLAFRAGRRRGYGPFCMGLFGSILLMSGKFYFNLPPATYGGMTLLACAFIWNAWPLKMIQGRETCPDCLEFESPHPDKLKMENLL